MDKSAPAFISMDVISIEPILAEVWRGVQPTYKIFLKLKDSQFNFNSAYALNTNKEHIYKTSFGKMLDIQRTLLVLPEYPK